MGMRHPNPRRVKAHHTYTIGELARLFGLHVNTVRAWQDAGLEPVDSRRPLLFRGDAVRDFLNRRREAAKRPCKAGTIFCLPCRKPQRPALDMVDYEPITATSGDLRGLCPSCNRLMHRRIRKADLGAFAVDLNVSFPHAESRLREPGKASVKCDLKRESPTG